MKPAVFQKILFAVAAIPAVLMAASERHEISIKDLSYGVALYEFFQNNPLVAIQEIDVGNYRKTLTNQPDDAELLKGGLYVNYGLVEDAERIFNGLLDKKTDKSTQNRVWFHLAKIQYDNSNYRQAAELFSRIEGILPTQLEDQKFYLLANIQIFNQQYGEAAKSSSQISTNSTWKAYTEYNLGIALKQNWDESKRWLSRLSKPLTYDEELLTLADTSQLALGLFSLKKGSLDDAIAYISRVRSSGPLSNKALLAAGWAWSKKQNPKQAITYWQTLADKNQPDGSSMEALLAIPYAYEQQGDRELAALMYSKTAAQFDQTLLRMDEIINDINQGELLAALRISNLVDGGPDNNLLQNLPRSSATPYLHQILAHKSFQVELKRYHELLKIKESLQHWLNDLPALELMLKERRIAFKSKRPLIEQSSGFEQLENIQRRRDTLAAEVNRIELLNDFMSLADEDESDYFEQLDEVKAIIDKYQGQQDFSEENDQYRLLHGLLQYKLETEFPARFWRIKNELLSLDRALQQAMHSARSLKQASTQNEQDLDRFEQRINGQLEQTQQLRQKVEGVILKQEQYINQLAIQAMNKRKHHLSQLRLNARYAQVRLYDQLLLSQESK